MVTDGALGSRTAALLAPYSDDPDTSGIMTIVPEKLKAMALERDKVGFQLAFHAIGDRANRVALDVFESVIPKTSRGLARCTLLLPCSPRTRAMTYAGPSSALARSA
jgi:predicted amidohydrolase YtcJ